jgi:hypothetical protein
VASKIFQQVEGKTCPESANPLRVLVVRSTINREVPPSGSPVAWAWETRRLQRWFTKSSSLLEEILN